MVALRYGALVKGQSQAGALSALPPFTDMVAIYNDAEKTICGILRRKGAF